VCAAKFECQIRSGYSRVYSSNGCIPLPLPPYRLEYPKLVADDPDDRGEPTYEPVTCAACSRLHLVDPKTGRVLGAEGD